MQETFENCTIKVLENIIAGLGGNKRKIFEISHTLSNATLHCISYSEAMQIARLLNMDYQLSKFYDQSFYE